MGIPKNYKLVYYKLMISKEEVEALAALARLTLKEGEAEALGKDISNILDYVGQVKNFSIEGAQEERPVLRNVMREDAPRAGDDAFANKREAVIAQFPKREGDYSVVRKIIQKDE